MDCLSLCESVRSLSWPCAGGGESCLQFRTTVRAEPVAGNARAQLRAHLLVAPLVVALIAPTHEHGLVLFAAHTVQLSDTLQPLNSRV